MKTIKGKNLEEQMDHLDKIIPRLIQRSGNKIVGMVTSIPIAGYADSDENSCKIISFLVPSSGKITKAIVSSTTKIKLLIEHKNKTAPSIGTVTVPTLKADVDLTYKLEKDDIISVSASCIKDTEKLSSVWITLLWTPDNDQVEFKKQIVENMKGVLDD